MEKTQLSTEKEAAQEAQEKLATEREIALKNAGSSQERLQMMEQEKNAALEGKSQVRCSAAQLQLELFSVERWVWEWFIRLASG